MKREKQTEKWVHHMDCTLGYREVKGPHLVMVGGQHVGPPPPPFVLALSLSSLLRSQVIACKRKLVSFQNIDDDRFQRPWEM